MTKAELIAAIAEETGKTKADIGIILESQGRQIANSLKAKQDVIITGIGRLKPDARAARTAKNPATGATVKVPAKTVIKFKASKGALDAIA